MFCNCTLAGTKACENCSNNTVDDYWAYKNYPIAEFIFTTTDVYKQFEMYNPETHELVEKKEAKIKRLKSEIDCAKGTISLGEKSIIKKQQEIDITKNVAEQCREKIKKLEEELKELE